MKLVLLTAALIAAPVLAQSDVGTSITTKSATSKSAGKPLASPTPTAKDAMQPRDTSITTRSAVSRGGNRSDSAGWASRPTRAAPAMEAAAATSADYPWCSRTVMDQCRQRNDRH